MNSTISLDQHFVIFTNTNKLAVVQVLNLSPTQNYLAICYSSVAL